MNSDAENRVNLGTQDIQADAMNGDADPSAPYPQFPLYIPSKGRSQYMITSTHLTRMGIAHFIIVEPSQVQEYQEAIEERKLSAQILMLDMDFKKRYELCDDLGLSKSTGSGPARNFAWEHSISQGFDWHWIIDDNIKGFFRLHKNRRVIVRSPAYFRAMEDFVLRYENVGMAGPNYNTFCPPKRPWRPFITNTRIYSCNLIRNALPFRWRGRYNEDVILSLDILKAGWCTIRFNAFLQDKISTQTLPGGNTDELYQADDRPKDGEKYSRTGTIAKSQMLWRVHSDVTRVVFRYQRWHHHVDYSQFERRRLIPRKDLAISKQPNNYGMKLREKESAHPAGG